MGCEYDKSTCFDCYLYNIIAVGGDIPCLPLAALACEPPRRSGRKYDAMGR